MGDSAAKANAPNAAARPVLPNAVFITPAPLMHRAKACAAARHFSTRPPDHRAPPGSPHRARVACRWKSAPARGMSPIAVPRRSARQDPGRSMRRDPTMTHLDYRDPEPKIFHGATGDWELVIGMEIHAQVHSKAKLFSGASTQFGAEPNTNVSLIDAAMPGMLPVINNYCVEQAIRTGLGLKAQINLRSVFDRKNYFYPDLPQGYQISQFRDPIVGEGEVLVDIAPGIARRVRIERIHLEQDAGKSIHDLDPRLSFVDLNRTGVALMEIVSRPDIRGPEEAAEFVRKLRQILRYLGTCDGNMQEGSMRADVNVSVCRPGQHEKYMATQDFGHLGTRCEIKNMNSMRFIQQAIDYEARRQIAVLEDGGSIAQETRLYDPTKGETRSMRSKEEAHDYRYFPDPDLLPLEFDQAWVDEIKASLPELPDEKKARFVTQYSVTEYDAGVLTAEVENAAFFEDVAAGRDGKQAANWLINELFGRLNKEGLGVATSPISPAQIGGVIDLIKSGEISGKIAKDLFEIMWTEGGDPAALVEARGMKQVTDTGAIEQAVIDVIAANPDKAEAARAKPSMAGWFVGQVMKATGGKAAPQTVQQIVKAKLGIE
ncbi:MAG: aspartyl-tRNA(Asn)/glutamyl-tRNA(Gln) amidotransferase subunit B [Paracoccaceae bacterium]|jgi:aspartyl-tRNA(Asn)/glutamyl-tRNA(Gln) amidotransferase subunit B